MSWGSGAAQAVAFDGSLLGSGRTLKGHGERRGPVRQNAVAGCGFVKTRGNWTDGDVFLHSISFFCIIILGN